MQATAPKPITVNEFRELPEGPPYYQLIEGDLFMSPTPNFFHQSIVGNIFVILREHLAKHPLGTVVISPSDVELSDLNVCIPDLYFVSNERKHILTKQGASGAPDLIVEVLSPATAKYDKGVKRQVYARAGVTELWLVDPASKTVTVYRFEESADEPVGTYTSRQKFTSPLLPKLTVQVSKVFQP